MILITHFHQDHLEPSTISLLKKDETKIILNEESAIQLNDSNQFIMKNNDEIEIIGIKITAVPAYNTTEDRDKFHPPGRDNGYILEIDNKRIYIAGDTENTKEMKELKNIYIAFLPMNQPYTMIPEQIADAVKSFKPAILYPYHYGDTDVNLLIELLKDQQHTEIRIRELQ